MTYANKLNLSLHDCCRIITGCFKPANVTSIHLLAGIGLLTLWELLQAVWSADRRHDHVLSVGRMTLRNSFMRTVTPLDSLPNYTRLQMWNNQLTDSPAAIRLVFEAAEALPAGSDQPWLRWRSLNRLCTVIGIDRAKTTMRWGYIDSQLQLWRTANNGAPPLLPAT